MEILTLGLTAKMGKHIDIIYKDENKEVVELIIKNNRGTVKDTMIINIDDLIGQLGVLKVVRERYKQES